MRTVLALAATLAVGLALAQTANTVTLERSDATIRLVNEGRADEGARTLLNVRGCAADESVRTSTFYAPEGGVTARITQNEGGDETVVYAPLMTVQEPAATEGGSVATEEAADGDEGAVPDGEPSDGPAEGSDEATIEALDATTTFPGRPPCPEETVTAEDPSVRLVQGRTSVVGGRFFLDRGTDVATMDGPVSLTRSADEGGQDVEAQARSLRFDLESDRSTLSGGVTVRSGDRVSEADELELDEAAGLAILRGSPAVSRAGDDVVRGERLLYDLETNDVTVEGGVSATFDRD